ncbi:PspC domain-containing protein [Marivirga arenosa]|uniref:PspC domain-containing protein n=1 Tax=Marivirga arenosa TaxID=3059076 RepID=A0AA51N9U5_9BACT|nr:PspC domain-containing protein [Marivirga sp. ABR2-2]WMN07155.1 PspC domain-containing protein [Marivirga sp. ABR2-2]
MKKNISINIGGIIFHIEEDGFDKLKNYLDAINRYFSDFKDSQEIISDIENRIAEIFLAKLKEDKQVIELEDVEALMITLGSIEDFKKAEETDEAFEENTTESYESQASEGERKLYRDTKRYIFGGVAAGIANYFSIDVLWIRLLFIVGFLGLIPFQPTSAIIFIGYILMWIFLPANPNLKEDDKVKKLYRSEENRVIGGVAKGLAAYFGTDVAIIRILFVLLLIPGGAGLIIYLVLWFITPSAKTVTEKMQMEGTPITLSNIEKNIKSSLKVEDGEESLLVKILLFPFRLIAIILTGLAKILGPLVNFLVEAARIVLGIVLTVVGLSSAVTSIVLLIISQGLLIDASIFNFFDIPPQLIANTFSAELIIVVFLLSLIPALFLAVAGISVMARKWLMNRTVAFSLIAIWFVSLITGAFLIPAQVMEFKSDGEVVITEEYNLNNKVAVLKLNEVGYEDYDVTDLKIRGYEGDVYKLEKRFKAQGSTRVEASENAEKVSHNVELKSDSILWFDSNIQFQEDAPFRGQRLDMTLYVPYGQEFEMGRKMRHILKNTIYINGYSVSQIPNNRWTFEENGDLKCLTCTDKKETKRSYYESDDDFRSNTDLFFGPSLEFDDDAYTRTYEISDFDEISANTGIMIEVIQSNDYGLQVVTDDTDDLEDFRFEVQNNRLKVYFDREEVEWKFFSKDWDWDSQFPKVKCIIRMPELNNLEVTSGATANVQKMEGSKLTLDIGSGARLYADLDYNEINMDLSSAGRSRLKGVANYFNLDISSAAKLEAYGLKVKRADIEASSAAKAEVYVTDYLNAEASSASKITYQGRPRLDSESNSAGRISAD